MHPQSIWKRNCLWHVIQEGKKRAAQLGIPHLMLIWHACPITEQQRAMSFSECFSTELHLLCVISKRDIHLETICTCFCLSAPDLFWDTPLYNFATPSSWTLTFTELLTLKKIKHINLKNTKITHKNIKHPL